MLWDRQCRLARQIVRIPLARGCDAATVARPFESMDTMTPTKVSVSPDELDAAILSVLRAAPGQSMWWSELRRQLPASGYWARVEALNRLDLAGRVHAFKVNGRTYVDLPLFANLHRHAVA